MENITYKRNKWKVFAAATMGYGLFYVCRLSLSVVKRPMVDAGVVTETELGIIGSALFFSYAVGKFVNGFLADRLNVRYFMAGGLLIATIVNALLGFAIPFWAFIVLWALNGWFQSVGGPCSVIVLNRWFSEKDKGTVYGFWSASHNIGEAITFMLTAFIVGKLGWQWGFLSASCLGALGVVIILAFLKPFPNQNNYIQNLPKEEIRRSIGGKQLEVLGNPLIWMLALASAFMYISRYAVNSWGVYYFEIEKGYTIVQASTLISISSVCGIVGTVFSGLISDKFFAGKRNKPACLASLLNILALGLFLFGPNNCEIVDVISMLLFGLSIGILICFLGGLMAIDTAPKEATGAAVGVIGIASYMAAGIQDIVSGFLIESKKTIVNGSNIYDFSAIRVFWLTAAFLSLFFLLIIWYKQEHK